MRDSALHSILEAFATDAAGALGFETAHGAEVPFELVEAGRGRGGVPLYCYRPLTDRFIDERLGLLFALPSYAAAERALAVVERIGAYLGKRGERRVPSEPRARAQLALDAFLRAVFAERSEFGFDSSRFELAYAELEDTLYEGQSVTSFIVPLLGLALEEPTRELPLGDGLSLIDEDALDTVPEDAIWAARDQPCLLVMLAVTHEPGRPPPLSLATARFDHLLTALRLFDAGAYALGQVAWTRTGNGPWSAVAVGGHGRGGPPVQIGADHEDELRAFCNLLARRAPTNGEVAWALGRFEMGLERAAPFEAVTDYLLALRVLLEPEGPASGRLAGRLASICVAPEQRAAVTQRIAQAVALERELLSGRLLEPTAAQLVDELREYLRALLRDVVCGHLRADLVDIADELLAHSAAETPADSAQPLAFPVAAPYSTPPGVGNVLPTRHDM